MLDGSSVLARLRRARGAAGWTLRDAARQLGISHSALNAIEHGRIRLTLETALALCSLYRVPLAQLVEGTAGLGVNSRHLRAELAQAGVHDLADAGEPLLTRRRPEELLGDALRAPDARVLVRLPVVVYRAQRLSVPLLVGFGDELGTTQRLGWLLDLAALLAREERVQARMPQGLEAGAPWGPAADAAEDDFGLPSAAGARRHPLFRRWRITAAVGPTDFEEALRPLLAARDA